MAVYTKITREEMIELLSHYYDPSEWELDEFEPISEGVSNTNYKISIRKVLGTVQQQAKQKLSFW